jgi:hypothetical protein
MIERAIGKGNMMNITKKLIAMGHTKAISEFSIGRDMTTQDLVFATAVIVKGTLGGNKAEEEALIQCVQHFAKLMLSDNPFAPNVGVMTVKSEITKED